MSSILVMCAQEIDELRTAVVDAKKGDEQDHISALAASGHMADEHRHELDLLQMELEAAHMANHISRRMSKFTQVER